MNKYEYGQIYAIEYKYEFMYEIPCNGIYDKCEFMKSVHAL